MSGGALGGGRMVEDSSSVAGIWFDVYKHSSFDLGYDEAVASNIKITNALLGMPGIQL